MVSVPTNSRAHRASLATACAALIPALTLILAAPAGAATQATGVTVTAGKPSEFGFRLSTKTVKHGSVTSFKTKGTYEYLCTVPGHAAARMKGDLKVT